MLTTIVIGLLVLIAFFYVAIPLLAPDQVDPLPDDRDPHLVDLTEEKAALLRAIQELDARVDLPEDRRRQLHERYEAKAAKVLTAIDEREAALAARVQKSERTAAKRVPVGAVVVLGAFLLLAAAVPTYLLPRVNSTDTITTTDVDVAQQLQAAQRAAQSDPSAENLLALGDMYLGLQRLDEAEATYRRIVDEVSPVPVDAYKRLAILALQSDLAQAQGWLQLASGVQPDDAETLYLLGEVAFARGDLDRAAEAFSAFAATPDGTSEPTAQRRIALIERVKPLQAAVLADPSEANLLALGDAYWEASEPQKAVESYFRVLTDYDSSQPQALSRTGQLLYVAGRPSDAVGAIERAATAAGGVAELEPDAVMTLADAYSQTGALEDAARTYDLYAELVGPELGAPAKALAEAARAQASGAADGGGTDAGLTVAGRQVFSTYCVECHGQRGEGGIGAQLAGNQRATSEANVRDAVRFGRGMMPAFQASLEPAQLDAVVAYVTQVLSRSGL